MRVAPLTAADAITSTAAGRAGVQVGTLTVTEGNAPALALDESLGFRSFGTEPMAIATGRGLTGKVHMWLAPDQPLSPP